MKALGIALAAALVVTSSAKADEIEDNGLWIKPKYDLLKAKWPHDAAGGLIYGKALLECTVGAKGFAESCKVKASSPSNVLIEQAALELAPLYKAIDPKSPRSDLVVDVQWDEVVDWLRRPSIGDMMAIYPSKAGAKGESGGALIRCVVQTNGLVRDCMVIREDKPGMGFGGAALVLSRTFLFKPATRHGETVEAEITIPISFKTTGPIEGNDVTSTQVMANMVWAKTPTVREILAEIDKKVGDKFADGQVVFQCHLYKGSGTLSQCTVANASPEMKQFTGVAQALVSKFQADPKALGDIKGDVRINLAFAFPDMSSPAWSQRYLTHPEWLRTLGADFNKPTFPDEATKAGLKTGTATVDCIVAPNGPLTQCQVISESVPAMGFGRTAQAIAESFVANPWGQDGLPVDGAHVRMPIQMDYDPARDAAAPAPTSATQP
jgi:TonB family protein